MSHHLNKQSYIQDLFVYFFLLFKKDVKLWCFSMDADETRSHDAEHFVFLCEMDFILLAAVKTGKEIDN